MKKFCALVLCVLFALTMSSAVFAADAEIGRGTPTIDGEIDSVWESAPENRIGHSIPVTEGVPIESDADLSGTWKALWDDDFFYILYEINDDDRIRENDGKNHWDDSVELYMATSGPDAEYSNFRWTIGEPQTLDSYSGPVEWADIDPEPIETAIIDHGEHYVVEAAIPWSSFHDFESVSAGQTIYLDVHVNDNDAEPVLTENMRDSKIAWFGTTDNAWEGTKNFGQATLIGDGGTPGMPKTGMGGTDHAGAIGAWALVLAGVFTFVGIRFFRTRTSK